MQCYLSDEYYVVKTIKQNDNINKQNVEILYHKIPNLDDACLLAQLAMCCKDNNEVIYIAVGAGWNVGIDTYHPNHYKKAVELSKKYKYNL